MNRGIWLATALLVAVGASAAEKTEETAPAKPAKASSKDAKASSKDAKASSKDAKASSKDAKKTETTPSNKAGPPRKQYSKSSTQVDPVKVKAVQRAKSVYMFAVESCERPDRCDAALRDSAETQFMQACLDCAPENRCEAERAEIKKGSAKGASNPCIPP